LNSYEVTITSIPSTQHKSKMNSSSSSIGASSGVWRYPQHKSCLKDSTEKQVIGKEYDLKKVIFDEITVREYPLILGDNPAVGCGKFGAQSVFGDRAKQHPTTSK